MRATLIAVAVLIAAFVVWHLNAATADTCSDSCERAYAACSKSCKNTDCFTRCLNEKGACIAKCG